MFSSLVVLVVYLVVLVACSSSVFDEALYEQVLNSELCDEHLTLLSSDSLGLLQFLDASGKLPTGVLQGNFNDLGDYHYCLGIAQLIQERQIQGKYCSISVPLPSGRTGEGRESGLLREKTKYVAIQFDDLKRNALGIVVPWLGETRTSSSSQSSGLSLGVCVPKACTPAQALQFYLDLLPLPASPNITITEQFCRLPGDKPFRAVDYVTMGIFAVIASLTLISTSFELYHVFGLKTHPKHISRYGTLFSVYTNTRRFVTVTPVPGALECMDGIRAISMLWVILGHTFTMTMNMKISNARDVLEFAQSLRAIWLTSAPITVDTFFLLSGILCVYSTISKIDRALFIRSIPLFYLHRLLRMLPLLATMVLLQASLVNHLADGPQWYNVATAVQNCRDNWWATLLYIQNYQNTARMCLPQSWYLAVDVQLYLVCPVILVFLFGARRQAWLALTAGILAALFCSSFYSFYYNMPGVLFHLTRTAEIHQYMVKYYMNSLTRAGPFAVGMILGYLLHLYREKRMRIPMYISTTLWLLSSLVMALAIYHVYPLMRSGPDSQLVNNLANAYLRAFWAAAVGWLIFACVKGYGGPINWFLSLRLWKLPARLSFAMYLTHYSLLFVTTGSVTQTHHFTLAETLYRYSADLVMTVIASFVLSILIDAPCSTLQKILFGRVRKPKKTESLETVVEEGTPRKSQL